MSVLAVVSDNEVATDVLGRRLRDLRISVTDRSSELRPLGLAAGQRIEMSYLSG
jgi:hypothetical protein